MLNILTDVLINIVFERFMGNAYDWLSERREKERFARLLLSDLQDYLKSERLTLEKQEWLETTLAGLLKNASWRAQAIFERRFDSERLTDDLLQQVATHGMGKDEYALLRSATLKLVEALLRTASELRGFQSIWASQSAQDHAQILARLENLMTRPQEADAAFEEAYRQALARHVNRFEPFGLEKLQDASDGDLYTAYVSLHASMSWAINYNEVEKQLRQHYAYGLTAPEHPAPQKKLAETTIQTTQVEDILTQAGRMVLQGPAGSGKTTLLQWLAGQLANRQLPSQLADWNARVPFFLRLRDYANQELPTPEKWLDKTATNNKGAMPNGWVQRILHSGRATLLLDGVDELPQSQRGALLAWLQRLLEDFPVLRLIVSSRPAALKAGDWPKWVKWAKAQNFAQVVLAPLATPQIAQLCEQWFKSWKKRNPEAQAETGAGLMRLIRKKPVLLQLARTPLLAAMLCYLYQANGENLPTGRAELYKDCVEMLLHKRQKSKKVHLSEFAAFPERARLPVLSELAEWMMSESYSTLAREPLLKRLRNALQPYYDAQTDAQAQATAKLALRFYHEQSDLLHDDFAAGSYNFPHRTFQSYLAACHIVEEDRIQSLIDHALADDWREVVILVAALGNKNQRESVYRKLLDKAASLPTPDQRKLYLLAGACLESGLPLPDELKQTVQEKLRTCLPPRDADDVTLLALAGESLIPHLGVAGYADADLPWLVDTLIQIGGEKALPQLQAHAQHANQEIARAKMNTFGSEFLEMQVPVSVSILKKLLAATADFELERYHEMVLAHLTVVWVSDASQMHAAQFCQQAQMLFVTGKEIAEISSVAKLTKLERLDLSETRVADLHPLTNLTNLQRLNLARTPVADLRPLANLSNLWELDLRETSVADLHPLTNLTNLRWLDLHRTKVTDLQVLANLSNLWKLDLSETKVSDEQVSWLRQQLPHCIIF